MALSRMRCGTKLYQGITIPENAVIYTTPQNRICYLSGISENNIIIRYLDGDKEYKELHLGMRKMLKLKKD